MKHSIITFIFILSLLFLILNCPIGPTAGVPLDIDVIEASSDPLKEITIECYNLDIFDESKEGHTTFIRMTNINYNSTYNLISYNGFSYDVIQLSKKINNRTAKFLLPINVVTGTLSTGAFRGNGATRKTLKINYPKYLSLNKNNAVSSDEITITSTKPFFDEATFTQTKLNTLLEQCYYIVWINGDETKVPEYNNEKVPVTKNYYILDKITPYSVTFKVPYYAKTGTVHIINEKGFVVQGDNSIIVSNGDDYAYYSTSEELVIK